MNVFTCIKKIPANVCRVLCGYQESAFKVYLRLFYFSDLDFGVKPVGEASCETN